MRTIDIIQTAGSNLRRNKTRSILTIIAVFIGATTLMMTNGIGDGVKSYLDAQISGLGADNVLITMQKGGVTPGQEASDTPQLYDPTKIKAQSSGTQPPAQNGVGALYVLTPADFDKIAADPDVVAINPLLSVGANYITTGGEKFIIETQPTTNDQVTFDLAAGRLLSITSTEYEVLLPTFYLDALGFSSAENAVGSQITLSISDQTQQAKDFQATVVGVVNKSFVTANNLIMNKAFSEAAVAFQANGKPEAQKNLYGYAITEFREGMTEDEILALKGRLDEMGYFTATIKDQQKLVFSVIDAIVLVLNLFGVVALVAASFGIINTLFMAVQERTKEIGLMKAVGMSRRKIFALFSIEAALLGLWGSVLGVLTANVLGRFINKAASEGILKDFEGFQLLSFKLESVVLIVLLIVTIAFLAGTLPARKASKLDPIEALRYE